MVKGAQRAWTSLKVGAFLASRYVLRSNVWASVLIVTIMFLTFLNVVVVRGVLVGLPEGASISYEQEYSGDVLISPLPQREYIARSAFVEGLLVGERGYRSHSARYTAPATLIANREDARRPQDVLDTAGMTLTGIDPSIEDAVTGMSERIVEGRYLEEGDTDGVVLGHQLLERYSLGAANAGEAVGDVVVGDRVMIVVQGTEVEKTVVGILKGKVSENGRRAFILAKEMRKITGRYDNNVGEMAVLVDETRTTPEAFAAALARDGADAYATIETSRQSQGQFLDDISRTFEILSAGIGAVGVGVAAITVFIVIFIVALGRKKQVGILKGVGIGREAIELSYVLLALFYASIGIALGYIALYVGIAPYIAAHPINFPFADGILVAPLSDTLARSGVIALATLLAGYIPARMIASQNIIAALRGR
jgi:putative ABC transport system permease protein